MSDDEDCYDDDDTYYYSYYEGSGSGDSQEDPEPDTKKEDDEEEGENWPPWVTAKPNNNDIVMVDEPIDEPKPKPRQPTFNYGPKLSSSLPITASLTSLMVALIVL